MQKHLPRLLLVAFGLSIRAAAQTIAVNQPVLEDSTRLVDGVDLASFQNIQKVLLEAAAGSTEIAIIDSQMEMLRARRAALCFQAAAQAHPELAGQLTILQAKQTARMQAEKAIAADAKLAVTK